MIDVNAETIVTFTQLARRLPHRRNGRPTHVSTIHRWRAAGIQGVQTRCGSLRRQWAAWTHVDAGSVFPGDTPTRDFRGAGAAPGRNSRSHHLPEAIGLRGHSKGPPQRLSAVGSRCRLEKSST